MDVVIASRPLIVRGLLVTLEVSVAVLLLGTLIRSWAGFRCCTAHSRCA
jgi:hypothetical protein